MVFRWHSFWDYLGLWNRIFVAFFRKKFCLVLNYFICLCWLLALQRLSFMLRGENELTSMWRAPYVFWCFAFLFYLYLWILSSHLKWSLMIPNYHCFQLIITQKFLLFSARGITFTPQFAGVEFTNFPFNRVRRLQIDMHFLNSFNLP